MASTTTARPPRPGLPAAKSRPSHAGAVTSNSSMAWCLSSRKNPGVFNPAPRSLDSGARHSFMLVITARRHSENENCAVVVDIGARGAGDYEIAECGEKTIAVIVLQHAVCIEPHGASA